MIKELNNSEYNKILELGKLLKDNFYIDQISDNEKIYVFEETKILGFIQISSLYETLEIINIVVDPAYRKKGIGSKLLNHVCNIYKPDQILLEVRESNIAAKEFYKKNKFYEIRKIKNYYDTEHGIVMERKIK